MKKTFVIQVEYPDCDFVASDEIMEVTQECIENHLERYFGANIMDGDYDRIKVKEVTDFTFLVRRMREAQKEFESDSPHMDYDKIMEVYHDKFRFESEVDEYLKKMEYGVDKSK